MLYKGFLLLVLILRLANSNEINLIKDSCLK